MQKVSCEGRTACIGIQ